MKRILFPFILMCALLSSCTHNDGDIGAWFGYWHLESITIDGAEEDDYDGDIFFAFQSQIIKIAQMDYDNHYQWEHYGTWEQHSAVMTLDFTHWQAMESSDLEWQYHTLSVLHLPEDGSLDIDLLTATSKESVWQFTDTDGATIRYNLKKRI